MAAVNNTTSLIIPLKITILGDPVTGNKYNLPNFNHRKINIFEIVAKQ